LHQQPGQAHIVIFQEDHLVLKAQIADFGHQVFDEAFTGVILRVGFTCEDKLHWVGAAQDAHQPLRIGEQQHCPLVGGEAAGEPNGEGVRVEGLLRFPQPGWSLAVTFTLLEEPGAHLAHQVSPQAVTHPPKVLLAQVLGAPQFGIFDPLTPLRGEVLAVELEQLGV